MLTWPAPKSATVAAPERLESPLPTLRLSSGFGVRRDPLLGDTRMHAGIDIRDPSGTLVVAAASGVVAFAGWSRGYGNLVRIDHGQGNETRYAHLSAIVVRPGEALRQGDVIGRVGTTGRSTGAHLHFELRQEGVPIDPVPLLDLPLTNASLADVPISAHPVPHWKGFGDEAAALPQSHLR